jgi:hypothetical protein
MVDKYVLGHRAKLIVNECTWELHHNLQPSLLYTNTQTENLQWSMCTSRLDLWPYETACCYGHKFTCSRHWQHKFHQTSNMVRSHAAHVPLLAPLSPKLLGLHFAHAFRMIFYVMLSATNPSHCMFLNTLI